ncbi:glutamate--cysteine ligase catalytic subunit-like [Clytia hemisphaerica]|uniref:Glutamate--cysteine ligase n=1 Tax=Clytia hemisphaerica TaxID=252671 RepID=A0A7M5ULI8_9CNID
MGLLSVGTPLAWKDTKKLAEYVKKHGIVQFINLYRKLKNRQRDTLKWGDEIEYTLVYLDHEKKAARLLLKCNEYLPELQEDENNNPGKNTSAWRMEYANYMIEGTPGQPFGGCLTQFNRVEKSMKSRREELERMIQRPNEAIICFASFPRIGCPDFTEPTYEVSPELNPASNSLYYPDAAVYPDHPRFLTLTKNIRSRRGGRQAINIPVFRDEKTPEPFLPATPNDDGQAAKGMKPDHVYMDAMGFGMGCSCLQVTFQACNIDEARLLYDQLAGLGPIMMALSAASPAFQGTLADVDCRWDVIAGSVDDRTPGERGTGPLQEGERLIPKSRYDCIDMYISPCSKDFNDRPILYDKEHKQMLLDEGLDDVLAEHIAHLFIRDPISLFAEKLDLNDEVEVDHFENIQSTNWQSVRFKPPPPNSQIGWRVEFRTIEVQLTDFENAAYVVFVVLLTRVILSYNLNLLIPISKVEENMRRAVKRDAVLNEKFFFRSALNCNKNADEPVEEMSIDEIINGKDGGFPGLISLMKSYIKSMDVDVDTVCTITQYLNLISKRASGELKTPANWMRNFIVNHETYKRDSEVNERIMYDLAVKCDSISRELVGCPELFGNPKTKSANVTLPRCEKVKQEVESITEKILQQQELDSTKVKDLSDSKGTLDDDRFAKAAGLGVLSDGPGHVQM